MVVCQLQENVDCLSGVVIEVWATTNNVCTRGNCIECECVALCTLGSRQWPLQQHGYLNVNEVSTPTFGLKKCQQGRKTTLERHICVATNTSHAILRQKNCCLCGASDNVIKGNGGTYGVKANDGTHEVTLGVVHAICEKCLIKMCMGFDEPRRQQITGEVKRVRSGTGLKGAALGDANDAPRDLIDTDVNQVARQGAG
ncbi:unannotated protein [freshwater metagenome]|uniref:Unannotated protein n=1 Tax=freshwater metagenome TaxID=449393 RepID=A0A6J6L820_9ZZZZ